MVQLLAHNRIGRVLTVLGLTLSLGAAGGANLLGRRARNHADPEWARRQGMPIPVRTAFVSTAEVEEVQGPGMARATLLLPALGVIRQEGRAVCFRVEHGRARLCAVVVAPSAFNGMLEARAGLSAGDEVVIFHNLYRHADRLETDQGFLRDNDLVDTDWRAWALRDTLP